MKYVLIIILSSNAGDSHSVAMQEFDDQRACIEAADIARDEIYNRHGSVQTTLRCTPKRMEPIAAPSID